MKTRGERSRLMINALEAVMDSVVVHKEGISSKEEMGRILNRIERLVHTALKELEYK